MNIEFFDVAKLPPEHNLNRGLSRCRQYWPAVYAKLLSMRWGWTLEVPFAGTDGRLLAFNKQGMALLAEEYGDPVGTTAFILCHEPLHPLLGHITRCRNLENFDLANLAADYLVNDIIVRMSTNLVDDPFPLPKNAIYDPKISRDYSLEQLYDKLAKDTGVAYNPPPPIEVAVLVGPGQFGSAPDILPPELDGDETFKEFEEKQTLINERILIQINVLETGDGCGDSHDSQDRVAERHADNYVPWWDVIYSWAQRPCREGWKLPFNRTIYSSTGLVCAGRGGERHVGDIVLCVDSSSSIRPDTWSHFLSVAQQVVDELDFEKVHLLSVSTRVLDAITLDPGDVVPSSLKGGGGTRFAPAFEWVRENIEDEIEGLVYLTDGEGPFPDTAPDYPVLWASCSEPPEHYPWGQVVEAF